MKWRAVGAWAVAFAVNGLPVVGHIPHGIDALDACAAGMDEFAHLSAILEALVMREHEPAPGLVGALAELTDRGGLALFECLAANQTAVTPNLVAYAHIARTAEPETAALTWRLVRALGPVVRRMAESDVTLMAGSDAPGENGAIPWGISLHEELELLVRAGLEPARALAAATAAPARFTGAFHDVGSIHEGKRADLLVLGSDPLEDITATRDIEWVIVRGRLVEPRVSPSELTPTPRDSSST